MSTLKKLFFILTPRERLSGVSLVALMVISMVLEMLGIGIVVPALAAMSSGMDAFSSPRARAWLDYFDNPSQSQIILAGLGLLFAIYFVKVFFLMYVTWRQAAFVTRLQARVFDNLFRRYLLQPWSFHLSHNSADLGRNLSETQGLASSYNAFLALLAESLVLCGILFLLLWTEPTGAVAVGLITGSAAWILQHFTQERLQRWGLRYWDQGGLAQRICVEALHGAKDIKVLGREPALLARAADHKKEQARMGARNAVVQQLPRLWFELIAVGGLCVLTAVMVREGKSPQAMVPTLGLFAAAAFRMLPSANRLISGLQTLRFSSPIVDALYADMQLPLPDDKERTAPLSLRHTIRLEAVRFRYDQAASDALQDVSLTIPAGSSIGLIGGSGAGKSTLVDILLGLLSPTAGRVTVDGLDIRGRERQWQMLVGYVPQSIFLSDDTIRANVAIGVHPDEIDDAAVRRALATAQLDALVADLPEGWDTVLGERGVRLSGGQRQRIGIARALYHDPQVLVLDEATSALDVETEKGVMAAVEALHGTKTLVIVAHRLSTVANCDTLYKLDRGRVVSAGSFDEVTA